MTNSSLRNAYEQMKDSNGYYVVDYSEKRAFFVLKRLFDLFFVLIFSPLVLPIVFITMMVIVFESDGPPIYRQKRIGRHSKEFYVYKLRSMHDDAESDGPQWATENDDRVTRVGKIIRKFRIDELPQFYNVLMGDMSVVGPRPERLTFVAEFEEKIPGFIQRLQVKPGLTGLAQINGGYHLTAEEKLDFDVEYIKNLSYKQEFIILLKTIMVVIKGDGAY